jgi:hypothetical protein
LDNEELRRWKAKKLEDFTLPHWFWRTLADSSGLRQTQILDCVGVTRAKLGFMSPVESTGLSPLDSIGLSLPESTRHSNPPDFVGLHRTPPDSNCA